MSQIYNKKNCNHACQIEADSCEIVSRVVGKIKFAKFVADTEN